MGIDTEVVTDNFKLVMDQSNNLQLRPTIISRKKK